MPLEGPSQLGSKIACSAADRIPVDVWRIVIRHLVRPCPLPSASRRDQMRGSGPLSQPDLARCMRVHSVLNQATASILYFDTIITDFVAFSVGLNEQAAALHRVSLSKAECLALIERMYIEASALTGPDPSTSTSSARIAAAQTGLQTLTAHHHNRRLIDSTASSSLSRLQHIAVDAYDDVGKFDDSAFEKFNRILLAVQGDVWNFIESSGVETVCMHQEGILTRNEIIPCLSAGDTGGGKLYVDGDAGARRRTMAEHSRGITYILHYSPGQQTSQWYPTPLIWLPRNFESNSSSSPPITPCACVGSTEISTKSCPCLIEWKAQLRALQKTAFASANNEFMLRRSEKSRLLLRGIQWDVHLPPVPKCHRKGGVCCPVYKPKTEEEERLVGANSRLKPLPRSQPRPTSSGPTALSAMDRSPFPAPIDLRIRADRIGLPESFFTGYENLTLYMSFASAFAWTQVFSGTVELRGALNQGDRITLQFEPWAGIGDGGRGCPCARRVGWIE